MKHEKVIPNKKYPFRIFEFQSRDTERLILPHWHTSAELLYCLDGILEIRYPQKSYQLHQNDLFFINSNIIHSTKTPIPSKVFVLQFPFEFLETLTEGAYAQSIYFEKRLGNDARLLSLVRAIHENYLIDETASRLVVMSKVYELFSLLLMDYQAPKMAVKEIGSMKNLERLKHINNFIKENHQNNLSLDDVAQKFNYNSSYFSRFYKQYMGITFVDYLKSIRLEEAYMLLRDTDMPILSISNQCGFGNVKSFYLAFKKAYDFSPKQYRQLYLT